MEDTIVDHFGAYLDLSEAPFSNALSVELKLMTLGFNFFADLVSVAEGQLIVFSHLLDIDSLHSFRKW